MAAHGMIILINIVQFVLNRHRAKIANDSETKKATKYQNREDIRGLGIETMCVMGNSFKKLVQQIARKTSLRTNIKYPLVVNSYNQMLDRCII